MRPGFVPIIARNAKILVKRIGEFLRKRAGFTIIQVVIPKINLEIYLMPSYDQPLSRLASKILQ